MVGNRWKCWLMVRNGGEWWGMGGNGRERVVMVENGGEWVEMVGFFLSP